MPYLNFTDLLNKLYAESMAVKDEIEACASPSSEQLLKLDHAEGAIDYIELTRQRLTGFHIKPKTVYRALTGAFIDEFSSKKGEVSYSQARLNGALSVAELIFLKANKMSTIAD